MSDLQTAPVAAPERAKGARTFVGKVVSDKRAKTMEQIKDVLQESR